MLEMTFDRLDRFRRFCGIEWRDETQRRMGFHICQHRYAAIKGPRQHTGKTFLAGELIVPYYLFMSTLDNPVPVVCTFPTLRVGSWVLMDHIDIAMRRLEARIGSTRLHRINKAVLHKTWSNGAALSLVSSDEGSEVEGLTAQLLIWDEAHRATVEKHGKVKPFTGVYDLKGTSRILLLGIGGSREALLSAKTRDATYSLCHITPKDLVDCNPAYEQIFIQARKDLGELIYRQQIECEDFDEGQRKLLPYVPSTVDYSPTVPPAYVFAIDVGRHSDDTMIGVLEIRPAAFAAPTGGQCNVISLKHLEVIPHVPFPDWYQDSSTEEVVSIIDAKRRDKNTLVEMPGQAHLIHDFILGYLKEHTKLTYIPVHLVRMERNALGEGLYDELNMRWIPGLESTYITNEPIQGLEPHQGYKDILVGKLRDMCRYNQFACEDEAWRNDLQNLRYNVKVDRDAVRLDIDHSDLLSVILIGLSAIED